MDKKVPKEVTLGSIEKILEKTATFKKLGNLSNLEYLDVPGFEPDFEDEKYKEQFVARIKDRVDFIESRKEYKDGYDKLPDEALEAMQKVLDEVQKNI